MDTVNCLVETANPRVIATVNEYMDEAIPKYAKSGLAVATFGALFTSLINKAKKRINDERKAQGLDVFDGYDVQLGIAEEGNEQFNTTSEERAGFGARLKTLLNATPEGKAAAFKFVSPDDVKAVIVECQRWAVNHPSNDKISKHAMAEFITGIDVPAEPAKPTDEENNG